MRGTADVRDVTELIIRKKMKDYINEYRPASFFFLFKDRQ